MKIFDSEHHSIDFSEYVIDGNALNITSSMLEQAARRVAALNERTAEQAIIHAQAEEIEHLRSRLAELENARDNVIQQAQIWAQEARTNQSTVQAVADALGCPTGGDEVSDITERLRTIAPRIKRMLGTDTPTEAADEIEHLRSRLASLEGRAAPAPAAELVVAGKHADYGYRASRENPWFGYDPEGDGMQFFATEAEAKSYAETAISASLDEFWSESVDQVCYGRVVGAAAQTNRVDRPETLNEDGCDEQGISWPDDCEFLCNYELAPVSAPPAVPEWQPIETAPRDGSHIQLYRPEIQFIGFWGGANSGWRHNAPGLDAVWPLPTHWGPLPTSPQREGGE